MSNFLPDKLAPFDGVFADRRVLVTGATGFKGSWLCEWLVGLGAKVCGLSIDLPSEPNHFSILGLPQRITDVRADVRDGAAVKATIERFQPEIVLHLAAQALVRLSYREPVTTFTTNVVGTIQMLEALRHAPSVHAAVFITSDKCYENIEQASGYAEHDRLGGKDPYSASKAAAEIAFSSYARSFFGAANRWVPASPSAARSAVLLASARAGNVIGGGDWAEDRIVPDCMRAWIRGEHPIIRSPRATRPWQHVLEPLSGYLWLAAQLWQRAEQHHGDSFNFGPRPEVNESVIHLIDALRRSWPSAPAPQAREPVPPLPEAGLLQLDCTHAREQLQWSATLNFEETARFTAEWYRRYQQSPSDAAVCTARQINDYTVFARQRSIRWAAGPA